MDVYETYLAAAKREKGKVIGRSRFGREIFAFFRGDPAGKQVILQGAIHAREWITALLLLKMLENARSVRTVGVWFLPTVNPDGVLLATRGISAVPEENRETLLRLNGSRDFSLWKANGIGVDLNVNFPADHGTGLKNRFTPASENFVGAFAASEPCTRALMRFTRAVSPCLTVSFHTKGEVVYWHYPAKGFSGDLALGKRLFADFGYPFEKSIGSAGGYKDWCIKELGIPAYTVEMGADGLRHPVTEEALPLLYQKAGTLVRRITEEL